MEIDYKFQTEYAKSNRSSCRACKSNIAMGTLRMAVLVQSPTFDGKIPLWFHFNCFFRKSKVVSTADIKNFDALKFDDQEKIRNEMTTTKFDIGNFGLKALAKNPEKCSACSKVIKDPYFVDGRKTELGTTYHVKCFMKKYPSADFQRITGLSKLRAEDKKDLFDAMVVSKSKPTKRLASDDSENINPKKAKTDKDSSKDALRKQSHLIWKFRNKLEDEVIKDALIGLLEYNEQHVPSGPSALLDAVSDAMVFGALMSCPVCNNTSLVYSNGEYKCVGMATEWARCMYTSQSPKRRPFRIPKQYHDVDFLKNYKYVARTRLFAETKTDTMTPFSKKTPLSGFHFFLGKGPFSGDISARDVAAKLKKLGGDLITVPSRNAVFVSSTFELANSSESGSQSLVQKAHLAHMRPICSSLLSRLESAKSREDVDQIISTNKLADWSSVVLTPKSDTSVKKESSKKPIVEENSQALVKMRVKGGSVVDPDSGLENRASVLRDSRGTPLTAVLGMVDLVKGYNSFYRLQLLVSDDQPTKYWVFRAWGRIGTQIGGTKTEKFYTTEGAKANFEEIYFEKTGNEWGTSMEDFKKHPFRFYPVELDYGEEDAEKKMNLLHIESTLHSRLQALMRFLFDKVSMQNALLEFEIDTKKMPLGKLSKKQIKDAYAVLGDLSRLLIGVSSNSGQSSDDLSLKTQLISNTTQFYTLIPHNFGLKSPPLLDNLDIIKLKSRMLEDLLEMEVAYNLMKTDDNQLNPLDEHYRKLKNRIEPLDHNSDEFRRIVDYMNKTHAATHTSFKLEVVDIFDVERDGEEDRYKQFSDLPNKMLLWHGSRRTNWAGILAQGLRIAPPEAPVTGYMFGKGLYFADMSSKSANYCFATRESPQGCMLLCEVALGRMHECKVANDSKLNSNFDSRKGVGATHPNPEEYYTDAHGVICPIGTPVNTATSGHLLYNEFIVYNTSQVKQKYLVWVNFKYT